jgi:hypothetical protein
VGDRGVQLLGAGIEASGHVDEHVLVAGGVGVDDVLGVGEVVGEGKLAEHVLAGIEAAHDVVGVQLGGQAHVDEIDGRVVIDRGQLSGRGDPNSAAIFSSFDWVRPKTMTSSTAGWRW